MRIEWTNEWMNQIMQPLRPSVIYWSPICAHTVTVPLLKRTAVLCTSQPSTTFHIFFALENSSFRVESCSQQSLIMFRHHHNIYRLHHLLLLSCVFAFTLTHCHTLHILPVRSSIISWRLFSSYFFHLLFQFHKVQAQSVRTTSVWTKMKVTCMTSRNSSTYGLTSKRRRHLRMEVI